MRINIPEDAVVSGDSVITKVCGDGITRKGVRLEFEDACLTIWIPCEPIKRNRLANALSSMAYTVRWTLDDAGQTLSLDP